VFVLDRDLQMLSIGQGMCEPDGDGYMMCPFSVTYQVTVDYFFCADLVAPATESGCPAADTFLIDTETVKDTQTVMQRVKAALTLQDVEQSIWDSFKSDVDKCEAGNGLHCVLAIAWFTPVGKVADAAKAFVALDAAMKTGIGIVDAYKALKALQLSDQTLAALDAVVQAQQTSGDLVAKLAAAGKLLPPMGQLSSDIQRLLRGYQPYGNLTVAQFVEKYWDQTARGGEGGWDWSKAVQQKDTDGFQDGIMSAVSPKAGEVWDRFGPEGGQYLSPEGTPYAERSLPPTNLNDDYHVYQWTRDWTAADTKAYGPIMGGKIAEAFGQPGGGIQYMLAQRDLIPLLVEDGLLRRLQ
jgi:hypothetical protein